MSYCGSVRRRAAVTFNYVGRLLACARADADGGWPHRAVRDQIERLDLTSLSEASSSAATTCANKIMSR
jgi:hypothetical protein